MRVKIKKQQQHRAKKAKENGEGSTDFRCARNAGGWKAHRLVVRGLADQREPKPKHNDGRPKNKADAP